MKIKDINGLKFNRLTVVSFYGINNSKCALWECICDCGNTCIVNGVYLRNGNTKSCGCLKIEKASKQGGEKITHGMRNTRLYRIWINLKSRCQRESNNRYEYYGGRGIKVCDEWLNFNKFKEDMYYTYLEHVKEYGEKQTTIDRINVNGHYCKENCRWSTLSKQAKNKNDYKNQRYFLAISPNGEKFISNNQSEFAKQHNLTQGCINYNLNKKNDKPTKKGWIFKYE